MAEPNSPKRSPYFSHSVLPIALLVFLFIIFLLDLHAHAAQVTMAWDQNIAPVAGYKLHYGTSSRNYPFSVDTGLRTSCTLADLAEGITYFFSVTAYDTYWHESDFSNEVSYAAPPPPAESVSVWLEAEGGSLVAPMQVARNTAASAGQYIWVPNGYGDVWDPLKSGGYADYAFSVPTGGDYVVWGRVISKSGDDDSFFVSMDNGAYSLWDTLYGGTETWVWDQVRNRGGADPVIFHLGAGKHTLRIKQREEGTKIDKICVTNDLSYVPQGFGEDATPVMIWLEAEHGSLVAPMQVAQSNTASAGKYIWVPSGLGDVWDPSKTGGYADYVFSVPNEGDYVVWSRVICKSGDDDSLFVSMDDGNYSLWDTLYGGTETWVWDQVRNRGGADPVVFYLGAGKHTLRIKQREDGTKIDIILITNDLQYIP